MNLTARLLTLLAVISFLPACRSLSSKPPASEPSSDTAAVPLAPSPRLIIGRILTVDAARGFAFIELASDAPAGAITDGSELVVRTLELQETGRLRVSRYLRGRTLGTKILGGQPSPGDEVVWLAP